MPAKEITRSSKELFNHRTKAMWISHKQSKFFSFVKRVDFVVIMDHLSLTHIIKSKAEPATIRIKRLLELISSYSFHLYYTKRKDMVLSEFLSRQKHDDSNPHEIIPISFNMYQVLYEKYYTVGNTGNYLVQTRSQTKSSGIKLPQFHGMRKNLDPNILPEKQHDNPIKSSIEKPHIGQGRAGLRRKRSALINQTIIPPSELSQKIPGDKNRNKKNELCKFHRSNTFHKQHI